MNWMRDGSVGGLPVGGSDSDLFLAAPEPIVRWVNFYEQPGGRCGTAEHFHLQETALLHAGRIVGRLIGRAIRVEIDPDGAA
jgi:hypothetical protein